MSAAVRFCAGTGAVVAAAAAASAAVGLYARGVVRTPRQLVFSPNLTQLTELSMWSTGRLPRRVARAVPDEAGSSAYSCCRLSSPPRCCRCRDKRRDRPDQLFLSVRPPPRPYSLLFLFFFSRTHRHRLPYYYNIVYFFCVRTPTIYTTTFTMCFITIAVVRLLHYTERSCNILDVCNSKYVLELEKISRGTQKSNT